MSLIKVKSGDFTDELVLTRAVNKGGLLVAKTNWCIHCKKALPELQMVASMTGSAFDIYVIDGDENPEFIKKAKIMGFPTILYVNRKGRLDEAFRDQRLSANILKFICKKSLVCIKQ